MSFARGPLKPSSFSVATIAPLSLRSVVVSLLTVSALSLVATPALADPKPEAMEAMKWGLDYCKDGLKPEKDLSDTEGFASKFQARLKTATAADPSIRTFNGEIRGMKVSEWIPKCEKELPAKVQRLTQSKAVRDAVGAAYQTCNFSRANGTVEAMDKSIAEFAKQKANAIAVNKSATFAEKVDGEDPAVRFAACEKQMTERRAAYVKRDADQATERAAADKKRQEEQAAAEKRQAEAEKKRRASLKGDRLKIYDKYGEPTNWDGDLDKTPEWRWHLTKTSPSGIEADCLTVVTFKGMKKVRETETAPCKW